MKGSSTDFKHALRGPCVSVKTPFDKNGIIDEFGLSKQIEAAISGGSSAIVLTYGDSLFTILSENEIAFLTKKCVDIVNKRALVIAATGAWSLVQTKEFAEYSARIGADMLMVMPPDWESSSSTDNLMYHFASAGEHIPVMVADNFLLRRPEEFGLDLIQRLYDEVPSVVALKDDVTGSLIQKICQITNERWALIAGGQKLNHLNMLPYGVDGYFSLLALFNPAISKQYWDHINGGRMNDAMKIVNEYDVPVFNYLLSLHGSFDAGIHGMLELAGLGGRYRRQPYHSLDDNQMDNLKVYLEEIKYLA